MPYFDFGFRVRTACGSGLVLVSLSSRFFWKAYPPATAGGSDISLQSLIPLYKISALSQRFDYKKVHRQSKKAKGLRSFPFALDRLFFYPDQTLKRFILSAFL
jgi:hypothetical protein